MHKIKSLVLSFIVFLMLSIIEESCVSHELPQYTCTDAEVSYATDVDIIVKSKCAITGCHNGDNGLDKDLTDFSLFQAKAESGEVKRTVINRLMPPSVSANGPLTQEEINTIACWTDQGSLNN